jgi:hypothetical protein
MWVAGCGFSTAQPGRIVDSFAGPDGLIAAENQPPAPGSIWEMTSGSLFRSNGTGSTGRPDAGDAPGENGSAVFRMVSLQRDFADVDMDVLLRVDDLVETARTPAQDYDGAHIWVRYQSYKQLYAVSVDRRDGMMIIKKKCEGGPEPADGGTYYELTPLVPAPIPFGQWQHVTVSVRDRPDGSVAINASRDGIPLEAVDTGAGCPPLRGNGRVGIRGDNAELQFASIIINPAQ